MAGGWVSIQVIQERQETGGQEHRGHLVSLDRDNLNLLSSHLHDFSYFGQTLPVINH